MITLPICLPPPGGRPPPPVPSNPPITNEFQHHQNPPLRRSNSIIRLRVCTKREQHDLSHILRTSLKELTPRKEKKRRVFFVCSFFHPHQKSVDSTPTSHSRWYTQPPNALQVNKHERRRIIITRSVCCLKWMEILFIFFFFFEGKENKLPSPSCVTIHPWWYCTLDTMLGGGGEERVDGSNQPRLG